jgi:hypothetical protein
MDDFERELTRMMHDNRQDAPFGPDDRTRLRAGVRGRRRARTAWMATGSALTVAAIALGTLVLSDAFATGGPSAPAASPTVSKPTTTTPTSLIDALRRDIPSSYGRLDAGTKAGSFVLTSPKGVKTYLGVMVHTYDDPGLRSGWSCAHAHDKDGGGSKVLSCTQLSVKNGTGWELAWTPSPGLMANAVEYDAPYKSGWATVAIENCNALHSCSTGSGPGVPPMTPTAAKPPLGMAVLHRISVDPDVISTAATPMTLPGQPYRSSASPTPTSHGSSTPATPTTGKATATLPPAPTGAARQAVLAVIWDVNSKLASDEDKAISAVREQCAELSSGVADPDAAAVRNFSYDGITITLADGAHINYGLRQTLCPQS